MSGIGAVSPSTAIRVICPVQQSGAAGDFHRDQASTARKAYATAGERPSGNRSPHMGDHAPFFAQLIANDNGYSTSSAQGAIAYLVARDRMTDLPVGFLVAKAV